jgi:NADH-quinone oxidoreductase subunit D
MANQLPEPVFKQSYYLNMDHSTPAPWVLRLFLKLDGEYILEADPVVGYGHRGHEKMAESHFYEQFLPNTSRMDYLSGLIYNHGYVAAVEKMAGIEVPPRAEYIRVICAELNGLQPPPVVQDHSGPRDHPVSLCLRRPGTHHGRPGPDHGVPSDL